MASNKIFRFGPVNMAGTVGNLLNPPTASGGTNAGSSAQFIVLKHIRIVNRTAAAHTFQLFLGGTGGSVSGTEVVGFDTSVAANSYVDWYGLMRIDSDVYLTGKADTTACLTIQGEGEIGVAG